MMPWIFRSSGQRRSCGAWRPGELKWTSRPFIRSAPCSGLATPARSSAVSVRPEPNRPAKPTTSPCGSAGQNPGYGRTRRVRRPRSAPRPRTGRCFCPCSEYPQLLADHLGDQLHPGQLRHGIGAHQLTVAQHRDPVAELIDLIQEVGDKDDPRPWAFSLRTTANRRWVSSSSREEVGSSRISTFASTSTARAMAIICWTATE